MITLMKESFNFQPKFRSLFRVRPSTSRPRPRTNAKLIIIKLRLLSVVVIDQLSLPGRHDGDQGFHASVGIRAVAWLWILRSLRVDHGFDARGRAVSRFHYFCTSSQRSLIVAPRRATCYPRPCRRPPRHHRLEKEDKDRS